MINLETRVNQCVMILTAVQREKRPLIDIDVVIDFLIDIGRLNRLAEQKEAERELPKMAKEQAD